MIKEGLGAKKSDVLMWVVIPKSSDGDNVTKAINTIKLDHIALGHFLVASNGPSLLTTNVTGLTLWWQGIRFTTSNAKRS